MSPATKAAVLAAVSDMEVAALVQLVDAARLGAVPSARTQYVVALATEQNNAAAKSVRSVIVVLLLDRPNERDEFCRCAESVGCVGGIADDLRAHDFAGRATRDGNRREGHFAPSVRGRVCRTSR